MKRRRKSEDEGDERERTGGAESVLPDESITDVDVALAGTLQDNGSRRQSEVTTTIEQPQPALEGTTVATFSLPSASQKQTNLLRYLFAAEPVLDQRYGYTDLSSIHQCDAGESDLWEEMGGRVWTEAPTPAHLALDADAMTECVGFQTRFATLD